MADSAYAPLRIAAVAIAVAGETLQTTTDGVGPITADPRGQCALAGIAAAVTVEAAHRTEPLAADMLGPRAGGQAAPGGCQATFLGGLAWGLEQTALPAGAGPLAALQAEPAIADVIARTVLVLDADRIAGASVIVADEATAATLALIDAARLADPLTNALPLMLPPLPAMGTVAGRQRGQHG